MLSNKEQTLNVVKRAPKKKRVFSQNNKSIIQKERMSNLHHNHHHRRGDTRKHSPLPAPPSWGSIGNASYPGSGDTSFAQEQYYADADSRLIQRTYSKDSNKEPQEPQEPREEPREEPQEQPYRTTYPPSHSSNARAPQHYYHNTFLENERHEELTSHMQYPDNYQNTKFLQAPQKNLILNPDERFLSIDSSDRDRSKYPNPFKYTIRMEGSQDNENVTGRRYKNVHSIELISALLPNLPEIVEEMYIILEIEELEDVGYDSSNQALRKAFSKIVVCDCLLNNFLILDGDNSRPLIRVFYPSPRASIDRMTITLRKPDGTMFTAVDNPPDQPVKKEVQNSFTFKIIEKIVDTTPIGHRNI